MGRLWRKYATQPVLAPLLSERRLVIILGLLAMAQTFLVGFGMPGWRCPLHAALGVPCPACGLSHATAMLCLGQWQVAIRMHAFAPVMLAGMLLLLGVAVLSSKNRDALIAGIERVERRTALVPMLAAAMVSYWLLRHWSGLF